MKNNLVNLRYLIASGLCLLIIVSANEAWAQRGRGGGGRGGGGARPSMGRVGGGGGRPMGGGMPMGRPNMPMNRPSMPSGGFNRPSMGNVQRPTMPNRPSTGFNPSGGGMPNRPGNPGGGLATRPTLPGGGGSGARPSIKQPGNLGPTTRPTLPGGGGNLAGNTRPSPGTRPGLGEGGRPGGGLERPGQGAITRPGAGGAGTQRPGLGNVTPGNRLPGANTRPGVPTHPIVGGGGTRPGLGDGYIGNRPGWDRGLGDGYIGNRPGWDRPGFNNPGWGWGNNIGWAGNWHNHCIHPHWGWYNGCWGAGRYWGSAWYRPFAWYATGWGLGAWTGGWGYGAGYYNPYYSQPAVATAVPYDYSQPVVVNNYAPADAGGATAQAAPPAVEPSASEQATKIFDEGLALFKSGNYQGALAKFDAALKLLPGDAVVHEVRALTLYALGDYTSAAASLNSLLSSAPGMDWTTMSALYGNVADYTTQLRKLESYCIGHPSEAACYFVLAYHYLVTGEQDNAVNSLRVVLRNEPKDATAKRMLDALAPPETPAAQAAAPSGADEPQTDLVGSWRAKAGATTIELSVDENAGFTWKASDAGKSPVQLSGKVNAANDAISLETTDKGAMTGAVKSLGPDKWQFKLEGAPASDPGLTFERVKS